MARKRRPVPSRPGADPPPADGRPCAASGEAPPPAAEAQPELVPVPSGMIEPETFADYERLEASLAGRQYIPR